jgi:hypothetical protein
MSKRRRAPRDPYWGALALFAGAVACFAAGLAFTMWKGWHF